MFQDMSIGLDLHAKSIHAALLDTTTGELTTQRLPDTTDTTVIVFIRTHCDDPTTVRVVYETGLSARHLGALRIRPGRRSR